MEGKHIRRITNTLSHLKLPDKINEETGIVKEDENGGDKPSVRLLKSLLDGDFESDRDKLRHLFETSATFDELFLTESIDYDAHRETTLKAAKEIIALSVVQLTDMRDNPRKFVSWFESISYCDPSIALKFAVQYNLWGGTVLFLGTKKHHDKYLKDISDGKLLGVFGLTELGHGSNVNGLETTATFDEATGEFVINSPTWNSQKYWPGNIAKHGQMATVFARLILKGVDKGIHAFVVPIRSQPSSKYPYGKVLPGVEIRDIGKTVSYNGIDNGGLLFRNVRIPRENMLDRFSSIDESGNYKSDIPANRHFAATMSVFYIGRICLSLLALTLMKAGVTIALSYSFNRLQFGPPQSKEVPIITYPSQQRRIIPTIARCYGLDFSHKCIVESQKPMDVLHSYSSGFKAVTSWDATYNLQYARESIGGQGVRYKTRISMLRDHADLVTTGEGDNTVLCQQVAKFLLAKYHSALASQSFTGELEYINNIQAKPTKEDITGMPYQQWLLENREYIMIKELHNKMYGNGSISPNSEAWFHKWNLCIPLCIKLTQANVDRLVQTFFLKKIVDNASILDKNTLSVLKKMCRLDSLVQINKDLGFFASTGLIEGKDKWIKISDEINTLCSEITPVSLQLTDAFAVPLKFHPLLYTIE
eukprot:gene11143-13651_t